MVNRLYDFESVDFLFFFFFDAGFFVLVVAFFATFFFVLEVFLVVAEVVLLELIAVAFFTDLLEVLALAVELLVLFELLLALPGSARQCALVLLPFLFTDALRHVHIELFDEHAELLKPTHALCAAEVLMKLMLSAHIALNPINIFLTDSTFSLNRQLGFEV